MRSRALQARTWACHLCDAFAFGNPVRPKPSLSTSHSRGLTITRRTLAQKQRKHFRPSTGLPTLNESSPRPCDVSIIPAASAVQSQKNIEQEIQEVISLQDKLLSNPSVPAELDIQKALGQCEAVADALVGPVDQTPYTKNGSAASALLAVEERVTAKSIPESTKASTAVKEQVDQISSIAHSIMLHPLVFITPDIMRQYVQLQSRLKKPETFSSIFKLYASKPLPREGTNPVKYDRQNPNKIANAISIDVADHALRCAIETRQLGTAMDIVESAYATKAFRRNKYVRKGLLPTTGLIAMPFAAYILASQLATYQPAVDPQMATNIAFGGILAYVGFTGTIGWIAVATANGHMDRVRWMPGTPLRERWRREEERAAIDKIAGAWGFRETWRKGEEEGEEWEGLREWIGFKGMILDQTEVMEGME